MSVPTPTLALYRYDSNTIFSMTENNNLVRSITEDADCVWIRGVPNDRQKQFFASKARFIAYGGARGGGKSWALRRKLVAMCLRYKGLRCLLIRRSMDELKANHVRPFLREYGSIVSFSEASKSLFFTNGSVIEVNLLHPANAISPMAVTLAGMIIEVNASQPSNARSPMVVNRAFSSNDTLKSAAHPLNAALPMAVTFAEMVIEVNPVQSKNA